MRRILLTLSIFSVTKAQANFVLPAGHAEAFMANAGAALEDSPGNLLFNPAGLGFRKSKSPSITVSGNAIAQQRFSVPGADDNKEQDLSLRPLLAAGINSFGDGTASLFVANPIELRLGSHLTNSGADFNVESSIDTQHQAVVVGASYARTTGEKFAWGLSVGAINDNVSTFGVSSGYYVLGGTQKYFNTTINSEARYTDLFINPGIFWKASQYYYLGLSAWLRPVSLRSSATKDAVTLNEATPGAGTQKSSVTWNPQNKKNVIATLGQSLIFDQNRFFLDVTFDSPSSQVDSNGDTFDTQETWTFNGGWRSRYFNQADILMGYEHVKSDSSNTNMVTVGVSMQRRSNEVIIGAYYLTLDGTHEDSSDFRSYGILFSSSVEY